MSAESGKKWKRDNPDRAKAIKKKYRSNTRKRWHDWVDAVIDNKCIICGYDKDLHNLHWHHVDPSSKILCNRGCSQKPISLFAHLRHHCAYYEKNKLRYLDEAEKCVRLCNKCHAKVHAGMIVLPAVKNSQEGNLYV